MMWRFLFGLLLVFLFSVGIAFIASLSGEITITPGSGGLSAALPGIITIRLSVALLFIALLFIFAIILWKILTWILRTPRYVKDTLSTRRERKGREALSRGIIAIGAGDGSGAHYHASRAARFLKDEPLTYLLNAQAAQMRGDMVATENHFRSMLAVEEMGVLAHRGLFNHMRQAGNMVDARMHAEAALDIHPRLKWALDALLSIHTLSGEFERAKYIVSEQRRGRHITKEVAAKRRAALLTAQAQKAIEQAGTVRESDASDKAGGTHISGASDKALALAREAHKLDPSLVPASHMTARILTARGAWRRASWAIRKTWALCPHRDLGDAYAHLHPGDTPARRLQRVRNFIAKQDASLEGDLVIAKYSIAARDWQIARKVLAPHVGNPSPRPIAPICHLMAEIEQGETDDAGRAREWRARAATAPSGPCWVGDNEISPHWLVASPTKGIPGVFAWRPAPEGSVSLMSIEAQEHLGAQEHLETQDKPAEASARDGGSPPVEKAADSIKGQKFTKTE